MMKKENIQIGATYTFVKSGNAVTVIEESLTGDNHFVVERVNSGKRMIATSNGLEEIVV